MDEKVKLAKDAGAAQIRYVGSSHKKEKTPLSIRPIKVAEDEDKAPKNRFHDRYLIPNHPSRTMFVGSSQCGKTTLAMNLLRNELYFRRYFDIIHLFSPTYEVDKAWRALDEWTEEKRDEKSVDSLLVPHWDYDVDTVAEIVNQQKELVKENGYEHTKTLFVFDDSASNVKLMNAPAFANIFMTGRHWNISIWVLTQKYNKVVLSARTNTTNFFFFGLNRKEMKTVCEDLCPAEMHHKEFERVLNSCTVQKYGFCHYNIQDPNANRRFRNGLEEMIEVKLNR